VTSAARRVALQRPGVRLAARPDSSPTIDRISGVEPRLGSVAHPRFDALLRAYQERAPRERPTAQSKPNPESLF
jgi:hypothetical protein